MAKSGRYLSKHTFGTSSLTGQTAYINLCVDWTLTSQDIENLTSTIEWNFYIDGNASLQSYSGGRFNLQILDANSNPIVNVSENNDISYYKTLKTGTSVIPHTSTDAANFSIGASITVRVFNNDWDSWQNVTLPANYQTFQTEAITGYADILTAPNFTDEENPTITYENNMGESVESLQACISFTGGNDDIAYRDIPKTGTSYTFNLTDEERAVLWSKLDEGVTSTSVRFYIKTIANGITYWKYLSRTLTFINYEPTLNPIVYDTNEKTISLTGDRNKFIKYFSNAYFETGATAYKGATINSQYVKNGDQIVSNVSSGTIEGVTSNTFYYSATDTRGYTVNDALIRTLVPYIKLTCSVKVGELTGEGELPIVVSGKYFNGSFGAKNNTLELEYSLKENGGDITWHPLGVVTPTVDSEGNYEYNYTITGLNYLSTYELSINAIDELVPIASSPSVVVAAQPVFDWGRDDFNFNVPVYLNNTDIPLENLVDYVRIQGTSGNWNYRQWYSGKIELWGTQNISNLACNTALGNWYRTLVQTSPSFPFTVNNPQVQVNYESNGYGALVWATTTTTTSKPFDYYLIRPTSSAGITGKVTFYVTGTQGA